jgi:hypothetical protein
MDEALDAPDALREMGMFPAPRDLALGSLRTEIQALADLAGAPELVDRFDAAVARATGSKRPRRKR